MKKRILLLNTFHFSLDDRVYYHQARSIYNNNFEVFIVSSKEELDKCIDGIYIKSYNETSSSQIIKLKNLTSSIKNIKPDIIICDSPISVIASKIYNYKNTIQIIYDITEWYPSKKNFPNSKGLSLALRGSVLVMINLIAGLLSDKFLFGEYYKSLPFRGLFFWKKYVYLPYYPDLSYIKKYPIDYSENKIKLLYSGPINRDKGIDSVIKAIALLSTRYPSKIFTLRIIGRFTNEKERIYFSELCSHLNSNFKLKIEDYKEFLDFCKEIGETHIFLDLRKTDFENSHCLPIKLFYYLACERPVIYSNLKAINKTIPNFNCGYLCDPLDFDSIAESIYGCISDKKKYNEFCINAEKLSKKFNWGMLKVDFISFIS